MKVSTEKSSFSIGKVVKYLLIIGVLFLVAKYAMKWINQPSRSDLESDFYCDAESTSGSHFVTNGIEFGSGESQSSKDAYTGKYSSKCHANQIYSMTLSLPTVQALDTISITVAVKCINANARVVIASGSNKFFKFKSVTNGQLGWQLVNYELVLPIGYQAGDTKVYTYFTDGGGHIFVDDMNVTVGTYDESVPMTTYDGSLLRIKLSNDNFNKVKSKRTSALEQGLLFSSKDDLVDGNVRIDDKSYSAKLRLKGDLLDHLNGDKWSFRVQLKKGEEWKGMKNFSIHNSMARAHISEWVMHRLFKDEGIMTPAYDFIKVELNEKELGTYAYEQHFDNQLLKYNDRLIGPILKHNDDSYWENVQKYLDPFPWIDASYIELFNKENSKDENFKMLFNRGRSMLNDFIHERKTPGEVFDLDKLTTYYALLDLSHSLHSQIFTNIRFYLDPITGKLEPIGFDCFGSKIDNVAPGWNAVGEGVNERYANQPENNIENIYQFHLLKDPEYFEMYMEKIYHYTSPEYLIEKQKEYGKEINSREVFIRSDESYRDYEFLWDQLFNKARFTRKKLAPKVNMSLRVFKSPKGKQVVDLLSYHPFPLEIIGLGDKNGIVDSLSSPMLLEPYNEYIAVKPYEVKSNNDVKSVIFRALGNDEVFATPVINNLLPVSNIDVVKSDIAALGNLPYINVVGKIITIPSGRSVIAQPLIIPKGYILNISAGAELVFNGGSLLSYGTVKAIGSSQQKIIFKSDGRPGSGILLSDVPDESIFTNCVFSRLGNYQYRNVFTNGAINIYKSKSNFASSIFSGTTSREGLSIVHSEVVLDDCKYIKAKGDAINATYSALKTNNIEISDVGGDAIKMTGGSFTGDGIHIFQTFTRALRCTDKVFGMIKNVNISDSETAVSISQNSELTISNCSLNSIVNGFIIKGKEEKKSKLVISNYKSEDVKNEYKVDVGSLLMLNDVTKK